MADTTTRPADTYSPLYFLASLGAGGLAVTFFMYLMFWVPHADRPVPTFEDISAAFATGGLPMQAAIVVAVLGIAFFAVLNVKSLIWNFSALAAFKQTDRYTELRNSNAETTLLAAPLATAMTVNAMFIVGLVFVPGLWSIIEYLFPMALVAFLALGVWAFRTIGASAGLRHLDGGRRPGRPGCNERQHPDSGCLAGAVDLLRLCRHHLHGDRRDHGLQLDVAPRHRA
jgi:hypothetical protein